MFKRSIRSQRAQKAYGYGKIGVARPGIQVFAKCSHPFAGRRWGLKCNFLRRLVKKPQTLVTASALSAQKGAGVYHEDGHPQIAQIITDSRKAEIFRLIKRREQKEDIQPWRVQRARRKTTESTETTDERGGG